ncbi:MAG: hypothetical protein ACJ8DB_16105 [Microvirga sp.]
MRQRLFSRPQRLEGAASRLELGLGRTPAGAEFVAKIVDQMMKKSV